MIASAVGVLLASWGASLLTAVIPAIIPIPGKPPFRLRNRPARPLGPPKS